ncbi:sensor histidine kinase [Rhodoferax sp.]|uniref:sensor histidine kinase n=1 Tax=Rhodoferax sp. TaxID=50421 RepID=UPI002744C9FD|nr:HAMP domain-containing sensor histidine kinase [Rhodoferax sp.]
MFLNRLYVRIWLAVVVTVAVLTLLFGWVVRLTADPPFRQMVVRDDTGQVIGSGRPRPRWAENADGMKAGRRGGQSGMGRRAMPPPDDTEEGATPSAPAEPGAMRTGPEFMVRMHDGRTLHVHLPRPNQNTWNRPPYGFAWMLALVAVAVALGAYPIVRKLTRRLELLQGGVEQWGQGHLSTRVALEGDDEVGFLAKRFNLAAERIEALVKSHESLLASQKSLLANASHELRSPLARIRMGLELMGSASTPVLKEELSRNIAELDLLIDEILLASRLDAKEADLGTIEAVDLVGLAAEECARVDVDLDVLVDCLTPSANPSIQTVLIVQGVSRLLRRALRNLLENARRHAAGEVTLQLRRQGGVAEIRVRDRGPGVPEPLRERIFEPFYRLPGATERDGGVGLGLSLVKSIATRHGGTVHCEDNPGGGACFVLRLPITTT